MGMRYEARRERGGSAFVAVLVALLLIAGVSTGVYYFVVAGESRTEFDAVAAAELAPADTHFFIAFNTDFASEPWLAVPRLLDAMGIEQQARDDLEESFAEEDLDYREDVLPALGSIRRVVVAAQYGSPESEAVVVIDSREPERVIALFAEGGDDTTVSEERDEELGLNFDIYTTTLESGDTDTIVVSLHEGIIYAGGFTEHISNFVRRLESQAPLSESDRFRSAVSDVEEGALLVGYGSGGILDHPDFRDAVDALIETAEVDPRDATLAFGVSARPSGWGARSVLRIDSGFGTAQPVTAAPADINSLTAYTPDDALVFVAGSGLHDALEQLYTQAQETPEVFDAFVAPFEDLTGLSLEDDLIPVVGNSYSIAVGGEDIGASDFDPASMWVLGLIESTDSARLADHASAIREQVDVQCQCDSGVTVDQRGPYVTVQWPDTDLSASALADNAAFQRARALLPPEPAVLLFVQTGALSPEAIDQMSEEIGADNDYDVNLDAILGLAIALAGDDTSIQMDVVVPIATAEE